MTHGYHRDTVGAVSMKTVGAAVRPVTLGRSALIRTLNGCVGGMVASTDKTPLEVLREFIAAAEADVYGEGSQIEARAAVDALEAALVRLRQAHQRCCEETDYCFVCDNHPSHGHAKGCPVG